MKPTIVSLCSALTLFSSLGAATATWQGGGGNSLWSTPGNWMGGTPPVAGAGDTAVFPSVASDYMPDNDIANLGLAGLNVGSNANSYTLISNSSTAVTMASGASIRINPAGTVLSQTFNLPIQMNGPTGVTFDSTGAAFGSLATFQQTISGSGGVTVLGALATAVQFQASNTYTGTTLIGTNGGLSVSSDANLGNAADAIEINGGDLTILGSFTTQRSFLITGAADIDVASSFMFTHDNTTNILNNSAGNIDKSDTGTFILTGPNTNTYAGSYTLSGGILQGTTRTINTNINTVNGTSVVFDQGFNGNYTNSISGGGSVTKQQAGILTFNQVQSYTNGTTIAGGTLALTGPGALFAMGSVNLTSSSSIFDISAITAASTMIGPITGVASSEVQLGSKFLATLINGTTTFAGNLLDGGNNGGLIKNGTGTFILTGTNNYLGGNTVNGGTLQGDTNSIKGNVTLLANTNLIFNQNSDGVYPGQITGPGSVSVTKIGSALLNMTGASNYTGPTTVSTGTLAINGSITSPVTVASVATLKGTGTISGATVVNGTLMPGNSIGTMNIVGDVTFNPGSTFVVEVSPTAASLLNIAGSLTILPDTLQIFPFSGTYPANMLYPIVTTTGPITGTFTNVVNNSATIQFTVLYFPHQIDLVLTRLSFSEVVTKGNPGSAAKSLNNVTPVPGSDLDLVFSQLNTLNLKQLYRAFNQMQPSLTLGLALVQQNNFNLIETTLRKRTGALHTLRCPSPPTCEPITTEPPTKSTGYFKPRPKKEKKTVESTPICQASQNWRVWGDASLDFYHQHRQNQNAGFESDTTLGAAGLDYEFPSHVYLGLLGAYTYSDVHWTHALAKGNINSYYGGLYSSWLNEYFYVNASAIGAYNSYGHSRKIKFAAIDRHAQARHAGLSVDSHLDLGLTFPADQKFQFGPYGEVDFIYLHQKNYHEHAAKSLNLHVHKYNATMLRSELGLQGRYCIAIKPGFLVPSANLSWVREVRFHGKHLQSRFSNEEAIGQAPRPFIVYGIYPNRNLIAPGASFTGIFLDERLTFSVTYQGQFGSKVNDNAVNLTLSWGF